jgi:hypothetical protein
LRSTASCIRRIMGETGGRGLGAQAAKSAISASADRLI